MPGSAINWPERLKGWLFHIFPHHLVSRTIFRLTRLKTPLTQTVIHWFIKTYQVKMDDVAEPNVAAYPTFNDFFVRALKPEARPIAAAANHLVSPVDGTVSQAGDITHDHLFQAKGHFYALSDLLGGDELLAKMFSGGRFATIYLAPHDYHRIHMPTDARLKKMIHVPGRLFSVQPWTVREIPNLFARNERLVCLFATKFGPMAMILVGAINVAAIETVWSGLVTPPRGKQVSEFDYSHTQKDFRKGQEMGRFNMGSTVILLTTDKALWAKQLKHGVRVRMGQAIGAFR
ncbi:MAG: archaetidylserine decarboxylase [Gammaproteobacteria bacterium]|nr:archaetidylserine decarboxylase [Gammaproteobacteria bacterium]